MRFTFNGGSRGSVLRVPAATTVVMLVAVCLAGSTDLPRTDITR
jgi:hypothetical protein